MMYDIIRDLGKKVYQILLIDPASRPPLGRVRLRKRHTVTFSSLRMTRYMFVLQNFLQSNI